MKAVIGNLAFGKTVRAINIIEDDKSSVISTTDFRLEMQIFSRIVTTVSALVPCITATIVPEPPCPSLFVKKVYTSPQLKQVSSILRFSPIFSGNSK